MNLHELNILFITYPEKELYNCKKDQFSTTRHNVTLTLSALLTLCLYSANDVMSKCYYASVISFYCTPAACFM